jgi:uncharacterized membrane protein
VGSWVTSPRREALVVGLLVLVALVLRVPTAGVQSFWLDEVYSARIVDGSLGHAWSTIQHTENTPPLFYLVDWLWTRVLGVNEFGLRSLSALAGALAVVPTVRLARRLAATPEDRGDPRFATAVGLTAGVLVVLNPLAHWFSQEARAYALLLLLGAVAWAALVAALDEATPRRLWLWAIAAVLVTWTHYFGGLLLAVGWGALVLVTLRGPTAGFGAPRTAARRADALRPLAGPLVASVVGAAVLLPIAIRQQSTAMYEAISNVKGLGTRILETPKQFASGYNGPAEYLVGIAIAVLALVLVLVAARLRDGRPTRATGLLAMVVLIWLLPLIGVAVGFDVFLTRNLVVVLPPLAALVALGAWRLGRRGLVPVAVAGALQLATIVAVAVVPVYQRDDWRGALRAATGPGPELLLVSHYQEPAATWYEPTLRQTPPSAVQNVRTLAILDRPEESGKAGPPVVAAPPMPFPQFRLVRTVRNDQYRVFVWEAKNAVGVPPAPILALLGRNDRATVLRP